MQGLAPQYLSDLLEPLVEAKIPKRALKHEFVASPPHKRFDFGFLWSDAYISLPDKSW